MLGCPGTPPLTEYRFRLGNPGPTLRKGARPASQYLISSVTCPQHAPHARGRLLPSSLKNVSASHPSHSAVAFGGCPEPLAHPCGLPPKVPRQAVAGSLFTIGHWPLWDIFCFSTLELFSICVRKISRRVMRVGMTAGRRRMAALAWLACGRASVALRLGPC